MVYVLQILNTVAPFATHPTLVFVCSLRVGCCHTNGWIVPVPQKWQRMRPETAQNWCPTDSKVVIVNFGAKF